jgi:hypothetical protein
MNGRRRDRRRRPFVDPARPFVGAPSSVVDPSLSFVETGDAFVLTMRLIPE